VSRYSTNQESVLIQITRECLDSQPITREGLESQPIKRECLDNQPINRECLDPKQLLVNNTLINQH